MKKNQFSKLASPPTKIKSTYDDTESGYGQNRAANKPNLEEHKELSLESNVTLLSAEYLQLTNKIASTLTDDDCLQEKPPGIRFTERMSGKVYSIGDIRREVSGVPCECTLTIESHDLEETLESDPQHAARLTGTVTCPGLSKNPLHTKQGEVHLFKKSTEKVNCLEMTYLMILISDEEKVYYFKGKKVIKKKHFFDFGWEATSTLFVKIYESAGDQEDLICEGELTMTLLGIAKQLITTEIPHATNKTEELFWRYKFAKFVAANLWNTCGFWSWNSEHNPKSAPRKRRELNLGGVVPVVHCITTEDQVHLKLTRYYGGSKGPLILSHGLAMASAFYSIDTTPENIVEFLVRHNYDVWLFDYRVSIDLPWANYGQYSLDDIGQFDFPAAVDKVLKVTGQTDVQILAHCVSSIGLFASLLSGRLQGKVRSVIASQTSATPIGSTFNKLKAFLPGSSFFKNIPSARNMNAYTDSEAGIFGKLFSAACKVASMACVYSDQLCHNPVCHRITAIFGVLYRHENLTVEAHDNLHEIFGPSSLSYNFHLQRILSRNKLVSAEGEDIYLPGMEKNDRLENPEFRRRIKNLDIPICFLSAGDKGVFDPECQLRTLDLVKSAHPHQQYERLKIDGYSHLDLYIGKHASRDVYPKLLQFLDKYSSTGRSSNTDDENNCL